MSIIEIVKGIWESSGFAALTVQQAVMLLVSFVLMFLAIKKKYEPMLLLPIAFGMMLANLPLAGLMDDPLGLMSVGEVEIVEGAH